MSEKRVPNFTQGEKFNLLKLISQKYAAVLEDKKTNKTSLEQKKNIWKEIESTFNASGPMVCFRSAETLRRLYENKKKELRKKLGEDKKRRFLTGGGVHCPVKFDETDEILLSIVNEKSLIGHVNKYDCDSDETVINKQIGNYEFFLDLEEDICQENTSTNLQPIEKEVGIYL